MRSKRILSLILAAFITSSVTLAGCSGNNNNNSSNNNNSQQSTNALIGTDSDPVETLELKSSTDKYRNYYEIFVGSFYDSNGDGMGDLNGVIEKLDYLNDGDPTTDTDLGVDGIWLMPIHESPTYHKYDVIDYYSVDNDYGTIDDMKKLIEECHKRGINIIIDMVLNHSSNRNEFFVKAKQEILEGKTDGYAKYYNFIQTDKKPDGFVKLSGTDNWYYEAEWGASMPDLNLANDETKEEIKKILKYWLDLGVDGFRLDAVKHYAQEGVNGTDFMEWMYDYAKSIKPDIYMVGELWSGNSALYEMYESGIDSLFDFASAQSTGDITTSVNGSKGREWVKSLVEWDNKLKEINPNIINATFWGNHDMARSAGYVVKREERMKMGASLYLLVPGNSYIYYGEEIGMTGGSKSDPDKRTSMVWSVSDSTGRTNDPSGLQEEHTDPNEGVTEQLANDDSLLSFYQRVLKIKNQNPEIARGTVADVSEQISSDSAIGAYTVEYEGSKLLIIHNCSKDTEITVTVPDSVMNITEVRGTLEAMGKDSTGFKYNGKTITLPAYSTIILK